MAVDGSKQNRSGKQRIDGLTTPRDRTAEPNPREQPLEHEWGRGHSISSVLLTTNRIGKHTLLESGLLEVTIN